MRSLQILTLLLSILPTTTLTAAEDERARLHALIDEAWAFRLAEDPLFATSVGEHAYNDRLPSVAPEDQERQAAFWRDVLQRLEAIDRSRLNATDDVNYEMFRFELASLVTDIEARAYEIPLTTDEGFHIALARLGADMPFATAKDYERYLSRLAAVPVYMDQHIANMRRGLARGMTLPRVVLEGIDVSIASHVVADESESVFFAPFKDFPPAMASADQEQLRERGRQAVREQVVPSYQRFLDFMRNEYIPGARTSIGASELPDGRAYYAERIRFFTTLEMSAEEVHRLGREEVARIRGEMQAIIDSVGFDGDFAAFLHFLRTDPRFYAKTPEELLKEAAYIAKRMDGQLPALFKTLPRLPYTVEPVPDHLAPKYTSGRYVPAPKGGTQSGIYWVNTYALENRPLYVLEALSLHEAVPGHHLQIALAQELDELPAFRRFLYLSAFGEGWGLYSEWLGLEAGLYTDPYSNFGRLTYEMWRACRLVVDTGIHAMGWSRQQALDFLAENTALSLHEVTTETDRYISWPGQALAYKIGELKIKELRRRAEEALGERFDRREFHDAVLANGSVTLPLLEKVIDAYIESKRDGRVEAAP